MRISLVLLVTALALPACRNKGGIPVDTGKTTETGNPIVDADGDGYTSDVDCDDEDADVNPAQEEVYYDGIDNDCDDATNDSDQDGDGYSLKEDCDDTNADINPSATEICDGIDNDCNDEIDDAAGDTWYLDADSDGYGDEANSKQSCDGKTGYVANGDDCDDGNELINPDADEVCDEADNDCDGDIDEDDALDAGTWYADADGDGFGDESKSDTTTSCDQPQGYASENDDCDDEDGDINPDAEEICDEVDNDCDGDVDEAGASGGSTYYADADSDGYGDADTTTDACDVPSGYTSNAEDCDDTNDEINPGASDTWYDGVDSDCDGGSDYDYDGDGYDSESFGGDDCNDLRDDINPSASDDWYDGVDSNCDDADDYDADEDGYQSDVYGGDDCDDADPDIHPGVTEDTEGVDQDCDGDAEVLPEAVASYDSSESSLEHCKYIYLDGTESYDPDGTDIESYTWDVTSVPSGSASTSGDFDDNESATPIFFADFPGTYTFSLTVTDGGDTTSTVDTLSVVVTTRSRNNTPEANAGSDDSEETEGECTPIAYGEKGYDCGECDDVYVELDGTDSSDPDDEKLTYSWAVVSGDATLDDSTSATPTATIRGLYADAEADVEEDIEFSLTVTDCYGTTSTADSVIVTVSCTPDD